jgi:type 1 glutamine amidotransferase
MSLVLGGMLAALQACGSSMTSSETTAPTAPAAAAARVLVFTATAGFRHESIDTARQVIAALGSRNNVAVTATEDLTKISAQTLAQFDAMAFVLTTGELPLSDDQKAAVLAFVSSGGGFAGFHSATDTLYSWPEYGRLVGAYFQDHPWTQRGTVVVEDRTHPATAGLDGEFALTEEFYTFRDNPRSRVHVLLRLDAASVNAVGDYPIAWTSSYGSGRVYYNALGHFEDTWHDARFQQQVAGALRWVAGR